MDELKIDELVNSNEVDDYVPEDPNTPVDDFEYSAIEIEDSMPEDLKNAIRKYNEIHSRTVSDLMESDSDIGLDEEVINENVDNENSIIEENDDKLDLKNIF